MSVERMQLVAVGVPEHEADAVAEQLNLWGFGFSDLPKFLAFWAAHGDNLKAIFRDLSALFGKIAAPGPSVPAPPPNPFGS